MKICRYVTKGGEPSFGQLLPEGRVQPLAGSLSATLSPAGDPVRPERLLAPIDPPAIFCIGLNYREHARETNAPIPAHPVVFMKQPAAVQHPGSPILLPRGLESTQVDYEGELVVVIGRKCKNVKRSEALSYVLGYTCGNDVSARDWQKQWGGGQFCRGKTFDTFAPIGPAIVTPDELPDPSRLTLTTRLNGNVMQNGPTADMIFDVPTLIEFLSGSTTLHPGTLIFTGTPSGVGMARKPPVFLQPGDRVEVELSGVGVLSNPVEVERTEGV